jgi:hypothetical protein
MAALSEATIARIRIDYEESSMTVEAIGQKYGVAATYISRLARTRGWLMRSIRMGRRARVGAPLTVSGRAFIAQRLCGVINKKIDQMEQDMQSGVLSPADLERDAKTVASMIVGMEKVATATDGEKKHKGQGGDVAEAGSVDEVERLQREIIERFESIQRRREAEAGSR